MDDLDLIRRTIAEADRLVQGTTDEQLGIQTPCTEWSVRDLINHITGGSTMFARCVEDGSIPDDELGAIMGGDNLGDDFKGAWSAASTRAVAAFESPGALEKMVTLPFGTMPANIALAIAVFDVTTHACDLASVTGQSIADRGLLDAALATGKAMIAPEMRAPGLFDPEQPCPDGAPAEQQLLAFAGRQV
jgi:uncharacterized protein (TIGR03086 family)